MTQDYISVTEVPGIGATREQLSRLYHRYAVASRYCEGRRVLEVGCGAGLGLGYLARTASRVVGGDYTGNLLQTAKHHHGGRLNLFQLDAHFLPFQDASFDTVVLLEALYYFQKPDLFIQECRRILSEDGVLVICTVNKDWIDFNPSPFSTTYYSAPELFELFAQYGFQTELFGAFPATTDALSHKLVSLIKRTAVSLNLIPGSMRGKQWLKRIFYGRLRPIPAELSPEPADGLQGDDDYQVALVPISEEVPASQYTILYAVGRVQ